MRTAITFIIMISLSVLANLLLKTGADASAASANSVLGGLSWRSIAGLFAFGLAGIIYAFVLRWIPLSVAQSFIAVQYVGVVLAASLLLSEPISRFQWGGIILIAGGIALIGWSR